MANQSSGGYRKPPPHQRFQPGQSGNPKGRPRGRPLVSEVLKEILFEPVRIKMEGRSRTCAALTLMLYAALAKAVKGDHAARRNLMAVADLSGLIDSIPPQIPGRKYGIVVAPELFPDPWDLIEVGQEAVPSRSAGNERPDSAQASRPKADKDR